jgi:hypothetical protein
MCLPTIIEHIEEDEGVDLRKVSLHVAPARRDCSSLSGSPGEKRKKKRRVTWFCCQCQAGPNETNYVPSCLECYHPQCGDCTVETTK